MHTWRFGKGLLFVFLLSTTPALTSERIAAQDFLGYSPYAGTWRLSGVREQLTLTVDEMTVTGSISSPKGEKTPITSGKVSGGVVTFTVESPDGQRTITFQGIANRKNVALKRSVSIHDGGGRGENGIFGARGPDALTATLVDPRGSIAGRVLDRALGKPLQKATISVQRRNSGPNVNVKAQTDANGAFAFRNLPAGDYNVKVTLDSYLPQAMDQYLTPGNTRFGSLVAPWGIGVNAGEHLEGLDLRLTKTSVISGALVDENGAPVAGAPVVAFVRMNTNGRKRLDTATPVSHPYIRTEDTGMFNVVRGRTDGSGRYRLEGMAPGDYYILAQKPNLIEREISARLSAVASGNSVAALGIQRCGGLASSVSTSGAGARPEGFSASANAGAADSGSQGNASLPAEGDVPLFFPGATDAARSTPVRVAPGRDVSGIDFALRPARLGQLHVSIVRPSSEANDEGITPDNAAIALVAAGLRFGSQQPSVSCASENSGRAEINNVVPGAYKLIAAARQGSRKMAGIQDVYIEAGGANSVTLNLKRGVDIHGQLHLGNNAPRGFDASKLKVSLSPVDGGYFFRASLVLDSNSTLVNTDGSFLLRDVIPGVSYELRYSGLQDPVNTYPVARYDRETVSGTITVTNEGAHLDLYMGFKNGIN